MQLDSLLRSIGDHCYGFDDVVVIARASSQLHIDAYKLLGDNDGLYDAMVLDGPGNNTPIGHHLDLALLDPQHVMLAVDDMVFYTGSDFARATTTMEEHNAFVWSWRLGRNAAPTCSTCVDGSHWMFSPLVDDLDYGYMFHTDGALYKVFDYSVLLGHYLPDWRTGQYTPNDLEAAVAARKREWAIKVGPHVGPTNPTCITWQINRVQTKYGSPAAEIKETSVDWLARQYLDGKRVDNDKLYQILQFGQFLASVNPPGARPTHVYASEEASRFYAGLIR